MAKKSATKRLPMLAFALLAGAAFAPVYGQYFYSTISADPASGTVFSTSITEAVDDDGAYVNAIIYDPYGNGLAAGVDEEWENSVAEVDLSASEDGIAGTYSVQGVHYQLDAGSGWMFIGTSADYAFGSGSPGGSEGGGSPVISSISPGTGVYGEGGYVQICGSGFGSAQGTASFGTVISWTDSQVNLSYSDGTGIGSYPIEVWTSDGQESNTDYSFTITGDSTPSITGISPAAPWQAGAAYSFSIYGSGFGTSPGLFFSCCIQGGYTISNSTDSEIDGTLTVDPSSGGQTATISVLSNGYNGFGFQNNQGALYTGTYQVQVQAAPNCTVQNQIIAEYTTYNIGWSPQCAWFTQTAHSYYYSFNQLGNIGNQPYPWALVKNPLAVNRSSGYGLDQWTYLLFTYGWGNAVSQVITSTYRPPAYDAQCCGGAQYPGGRHKFGDAVDIANASQSQGEHDAKACWAGLTAASQYAQLVTACSAFVTADAGADWIEPVAAGGCALRCVHADWRSHDNNAYSQ